MSPQQVIEAELTLTPGGWRRGVGVAVDGDGRIESVGPLHGPATRRLPGRALLPGMVSAHSHAFQRGLRGLGERFPEGAGSFWTWREAMYGLVESLDAAGVRELSRRAFLEMRDAGITSVGEFHYLRHGDDPYAFDEAVLRAAADAGIRIALLPAHYRTGGIGRALSGGQRRFDTGSPEEYWGRLDGLETLLDPATQSLGAAAHSVRAVPVDEIAELHREAARRGLVFHMHLEEQPAEIAACLEHYGATPMALVNDRLDVHSGTTMVHCTHTRPEDMAPYLESGGRVCLCPLTEANLGDGLADVPFIAERGGKICLGSDSNARISLLEEARLLEYGQRLRTGSRGVLRDPDGQVAPRLWRFATAEGARSLGLDAGTIEPGRFADFVEVDLGHPSLEGCDEDALLAALLLGAPDGVVAATCVGGAWREKAVP